MYTTKEQRNALHKAIAGAGLDPKSCELDLGPKEQTASEWFTLSDITINHYATRSFFIVGDSEPKTYRFRGMSQVADEDNVNWSRGTWGEVVAEARKWAAKVAEYDGTPDFWADLARGTDLTDSLVGSADNTTLSRGERDEISERLDEIKSYIRESYELSARQMQAIECGLDEVKDASSRLGRKDLKLLAYGQALNLFFTYAIPPQVVQSIITTVITGLGHIFGLGGMPPALPLGDLSAQDSRAWSTGAQRHSAYGS